VYSEQQKKVLLMFFIPVIVTKFIIYKNNRCTSNIHSNTISCLLLHVL